MPAKPEHNDPYGEMDFGQFLRALYRRKWVILAVTFLAAAGAAVYTLTLPNVYESTAALIVRDPLQALETAVAETVVPGDTPTLSVESLQTLTESAEIRWALFESLWEKKLIPAWTDETRKLAIFQGFQSGLSTELKRQQGRRSAAAVELLPILVLKARATSPEVAQTIANEWADLVEKKSREVYMLGVEASGRFIGEMFKKSDESLDAIESELMKTTLEGDLTLRQAQKSTIGEKINVLESAILELDIELAVNEKMITEGRLRTEGLEIEGVWIGTAAEDLLLRSAPYPFDPAALSDQARNVLKLVESKVAGREKIRRYRLESGMLTKEKEFEHNKTDMVRILAEKAQAESELAGLEGALAAYNERLESLPERQILNKAITDDALWTDFLQEGGASDKTVVPLKSESLNPVHLSTLQSVVQTNSEIQRVKATINQLTGSAASVVEAMGKLELEIDQIKQEVDRQTVALTATESSLTQFLTDYLEEKNSVDKLLVTNLRKREERDTRLAKQEEFQGQVRVLEEQVAGANLEIEQLTREAATTRSVRSALASRAEAVTLLQVSAENASRTGTAVLYKAQLNPGKVAPARSRFVLFAAAAVMIASSALVCGALLLQESDK